MNTHALQQLEKDLLDYTATKTAPRDLSAAELASARKIYGTTIDFDKVEVVPHSFRLFKGRPFTLHNRIHLPKEWYLDDMWSYTGSQARAWYFRTIVIHELAHVWQYQTPSLDYHWLKALVESLKYGDDVYSYDIKDHACLPEFRFEQQAQILQDYSHCVLRYNERPRRHRDVIHCNIPQPSDSIVDHPNKCTALPTYLEKLPDA